MAKMTVPADAELQPFLDEGTFGGDEPVRIHSAEVRDVPGANESQEKYIDIRVGVPSKRGLVFVSTNPFRDHTKLTPNSGSKATKFLRALGFADHIGDGFDLDGLPGMEVIVQVGVRKDKDTGQVRNWIRNISRKA